MHLLHILTKLKTYIIIFLILTLAAIFSNRMYNNHYELITEFLNTKDAESEFLCTAVSFPYFRKDGKVSFFGEISDHKTSELNGRKVYFVIKNIGFEFGNGDTLKIKGKIQNAAKSGNEGAFDYSEYLKGQSCVGVCYPDGANAALHSQYDGIFSGIYSIREKFNKSAGKHMPESNAALLQAVISGDRNGMTVKDENAFKLSGIYHIVAISGLHLNLFILIIFRLISLVRLKRFAKSVLSLAASVITGVFILLFTGMGVSVIRAFVMMIILGISNTLPRKSNGKYTLVITAYIILISMPYDLYNIAFWLSTLSTMGVMVSGDVIKLMKDKNKLRFVHSTYFGNTLAVSVMTTLFTLPVTYMSFGYITPYAFITNAFVLPVMKYYLGFGVLFAVFVHLPTAYAEFFISKILHLISEYIILTAGKVASLPFAAVDVYPIYLKVLFFGIAVLLICCYTYKRRGLKAASVICTVLILCGVLFPVFRLSNDKIEVTFADAGQGDCAIIQTNDANLMVDCGTTGNKSFTRSAIESVLKTKNIRQLDMVFVSHFHSDHMNIITDLIESDRINALAIPRYMNQSEETAFSNKTELLDACISSNTKVYYLSEGTQINIDDDIKIDVLSPTENIYDENNDMSVIMNLSYGESEFLFCGDAEDDAIKNLKNPLPEFDVIKIPHHGGHSDGCITFLDNCDARLAVISCGTGNRYKHPHSKITDSLEENRIEYYRTDKDGAITVTADKNENFYVKTVR